MKPALFFISLLCYLTPFAQKKHPGFREVDKKILEMEKCSFEPEANAMVLFEHSDINILVTPQSTKTTIDKKTQVKIFNEKGFRHATIRIPYLSKKKAGKIKNLKAVVYSLQDGKVVTQKLDSDDFYKMTRTENLGMVSFTFPNLRSGSVIEYSYTLVHNNVLSIEPWFIQREIPVAYSSVWITYPTSSEVAAFPLGMDTINEHTETKTDFILRKILYKENVPSFTPEPFMSSIRDHSARVVFQFFPQQSFFFGGFGSDNPEAFWKFISGFLKPFIGKLSSLELEGTNAIVAKARSLASPEEKIRFLFDTTRLHMETNSGQSLMMDDLNSLWTNREGTSSEINMLLMNLLTRSGVKTEALFISTRENGKVNYHFPGLGQFNGIDVIAYDSAKLYILDASNRFGKFLNPPQNILNRQALLVNEDGTWIEITDDRFLVRQEFSMDGEILADGTLKATAATRYHDYSKEMRIDSNSVDQEDSGENSPPGLKVVSYSRENFLPNDLPLQETIELTIEPQVTGDFYFYTPQSITAFRKNLFTADFRKTDIDLGSKQQYSTSIKLALSKEWEIESLPENVMIRAPDSSIIFRQSVVRNSTGIEYSQLFEIRREVFQKEEYAGLQEFFKLIYSRVSKDFVLRKKVP
jgi:hypothetical protein